MSCPMSNYFAGWVTFMCCISCGGGTSVSLPAAPIVGNWHVSAVETADPTCDSSGGFSLPDMLIMNPDGGPNDLEVNFLMRMDIVVLEGVQPLELSCNRSEVNFECSGILDTMYHQPDEFTDAAWPLTVSLSGEFYEYLVCADMDYLYDFTAFRDGVLRIRLSEQGCIGTGCDGQAVPLGSDGTPICIQESEVAARWNGCDTGGNQCADLSADVVCF